MTADHKVELPIKFPCEVAEGMNTEKSGECWSVYDAIGEEISGSWLKKEDAQSVCDFLNAAWSGPSSGDARVLDVEELAAKFHEVYQVEARRQGDVRHKDAYSDLPENIKEFDRVLARYVLSELRTTAKEEKK